MTQEHTDNLMRRDLQDSLKRHYVDPRRLSTFQRILLTTDGTVTEILEAYLYEKVQVMKLSQREMTVNEPLAPLNVNKGEDVVERKILLQGTVSRKNFIYAKSILIPDRLDKKIREGLEQSVKPIGQLWLENKIETYREIIDSGVEEANELAQHFHVSENAPMLFRVYRVFSNKTPVILITEKFPESFFLKDF